MWAGEVLDEVRRGPVGVEGRRVAEDPDPDDPAAPLGIGAGRDRREQRGDEEREESEPERAHVDLLGGGHAVGGPRPEAGS